MKKLRKKIYEQTGRKIRVFYCGEYGEVCKRCDNAYKFCKCRFYIPTLGRPHYHALIFGYNFPDKEIFKISEAGEPLYISKMLDETWNKGISSIGEVTFQSAAYTARYIMKKKTGEQAVEHYKLDRPLIDPATGEIIETRIPEYVQMSRADGIGKKWLEQFHTDAFPDDFIVVDGKKHKVPRYYDTQLEQFDQETHRQIKIIRKHKARKHEANNTPARLKVRETIANEQLKKLKRESL